MKKIIAAVAAVAASVVLAAPASAAPFYQCTPNVGVASMVTSCLFANNVYLRYPYSTMRWGVVLHDVYSPATGLYYDMYCDPGSVTFGASGYTVNAEICVGGDGAAVAVIG